MKNNLLKCYINGKKSACHICGDSVYLLSFNAAFDSGVRLENMRGYQKAMVLRSASVDSFSPLGLESAIFADLGAVGVSVSSVCFEGSEKYAEYRANIRTYSKGAKKAAAPAAAAPVPAPAAAPVAAPVVTPAAPAEPDEIRHKNFDIIAAIVKDNKMPVYLFGPAGSGKNVTCEQVAKHLGLEFHYTNCVTQEYQLKGFIDAGGVYHETEFFRAFTRGGLFMLDEFDASDPCAAIILNAAIRGDASGRVMEFPTGFFRAHPDFRVIAAGNTIGAGATLEYSGRNQLDGATMNGWAKIEMDYDPRVENRLGDSAVVSFVRDLRAAAARVGYSLILGYRNIVNLQYLSRKFDACAAVSMSIAAGLLVEDLKVLYNALSDKSNVFAAALCSLAGL